MTAQFPVAADDFATTLPGELACAIFDYLPLRPDLIRVSHVSQRWRELTRAHPSFWRYVDLRDDGRINNSREYNLMRAQLLASEVSGLRIGIDIDRDVDYWAEPDSDEESDSQNEDSKQERIIISSEYLLELAVLLKQNIHRIAQLRLNVCPMVFGHLNDTHLFEMPAPSLEELEVTVRGSYGEHPCSFDWSFIRYAPKLRVLRLHADLNVEADDKIIDYSHSSLEELAWKPAYNSDIQIPSVDGLLNLFPKLRSLSLPEQLDRQDFRDPAAASERFAKFDWLGLPDEVFTQLDVAQLTRVPYLYVYDPIPNVIHEVVSHFLQREMPVQGRKPSATQPLHVENWPWDPHAWRQPLIITDPSPGGRIRAVDIVRYTWLPNVPAMGAIADRVTRLAVPMKEWQELIQAFCGVPALVELTLLVYSSEDRVHFLHQPGTVESSHLRRVVLKAAQKTYAAAESVDLVASDVATFIERAIDSGVRRKMDLVVDGINWVADTEEENNVTLDELMAPYFSNFQLGPLEV